MAPDNRRRPSLNPAVVPVVVEACAGFLALVLLIGRNPLDLRNRWLGDLDTKYYGWLAWRIAHLDGPALHLGGVVHPAGLEIGLLDGLAPISAAGLLVRLFGRYLGLNLVIVGGIAGNYLAARRLAGVMGSRGVPRLLCALAFAAAPLLSSPASSFPSLLWAFTTPLLLAEVVPGARGDRPVRPLIIAGLLIGAYLCSIYHLVFGGMAALIVALCWPGSAFRRRSGARRAALALLVTLVVLTPFGLARLRYTADELAAGAPSGAFVADARTFSADAVDIAVLPAPLRRGPRVGLGVRPLEPYRQAGIGWALLGGVALAWSIRRRVAPDRGRGVAPLTIAAGVLWLASLGPGLVVAGHRPFGDTDWLPYRALLAVPGLGALRAPYRAAIPLAAVVVALLALGLDRPAGVAARRRTLAVVAVLVALSWWPQLPTSRAEAPAGLRPAFEAIAAAPATADAAIMVVPFTCAFDDLDVMNWQVVHRHPMVTCGVSTSATRWYTRAAPWFTVEGFAATRCAPEIDVLGGASRFPASTRLDAGGIEQLRSELGVRWVVFDRGRAAGCATAPATMVALEGHAVVADDGRFVLFDLG